MAVTYGANNDPTAVSFAYCQTEVNVAGTEMDPSGSDQLFTVIKLRIRAQLNPSLYPNLIQPNADPAAVLARIRHYLTQPRRPLYYDLLSPPYQRLGPAIIDLPDGRDDANGPIPDADAFSAVYTTPNCIEVTWAVTIKTRDCLGYGSSGAILPLSYRWETGIEFDKYWKATYRQSGYVIFSSKSQLTPDNARRDYITPQVLPGFAREQAHYKVSADGLRCDFEFIDGQIRYAPPYPVVDMDIIQSESFPLPGGKRVGEVTVNLKGMLHANPIDLEFWCFVVAWGRMNAAKPLAGTKTYQILGNGVFSTHEAKDAIEASLTFSYMIDPLGEAELRSSSTSGLYGGWSVRLGNRLGFGTGSESTVGGVQPGTGGSGQGLPPSVANTLNAVTQQGRITARNQPFPWVGYGTSPADPRNGYPGGFANWAQPGASMTGPVQGLPLADAVVLYAAWLRDPCGANVPVMPNAQHIATTVNLDPATWNSGIGGASGATPTTPAQLTASLTQFMSTASPTTPQPSTTTSPYQTDPRPGAYDLWQCSAEYTENPGTIVVPSCSPTGISVKINYANAQWVLTMRWVAKRTGSWPLLPRKALTDSNWIYTGGTVPVREMRMSGEGHYIYEASGVYEFMALDPSKVKATAAIPPTLSTSEFAKVANWVGLASRGLLNGDSAAVDLITFPGGQSQQGAPVLSSGGGSPLGGGTLGVPTPN